MMSFSININNKWHGNKDNICLLLNAVAEVILQKYELTIYAFTERNIRIYFKGANNRYDKAQCTLDNDVLKYTPEVS